MMRLPVIAPLLGLLVLAGCSSAPGQSSGEDLAGAAPRPATMRAPATGPIRPGIASRPDDGQLLRYDATRQPTPAGTYGGVPVALSEAHAYAALAGGELVVTAPDGQRLRLRVSRHEEQPDGNWTLVADDRGGARALLTFGQDAVFGFIDRADGSRLGITTRHRQVYLEALDARQRARFENPGEGTRADLLVPPSLAVAASRPSASADAVAGADAATPAMAAAAAANEIDVLAGYSNGLVARIGSESGAITRMQFLTAVTNDAYLRSGVTMRIRLVRSMLVNYTDLTGNQDTLQKMTGSTGSGSIPVDAAFNALRAAREETGADLVAFVRQFREPEQGGCGVAWILGSGQSTIGSTSANFAYSVSSDGNDDGFRCRDETFAHELGHNMGQAHNIEDSTGTNGQTLYGAHAYSFGYREAGAGGFYTIMAYGLRDANNSSLQVAVPYFANPAVTADPYGRTTGVANQADNARSLNLTMPIIAAFRASLVIQPTRPPAPHDVNADGRSDVYLRGGTAFAAWGMNGTTKVSDGYLGDGGNGWRFVGFGNFDNAGGSDLLWASTTSMKIWFNDGRGRYVVYPVGNYGNGYSPIGTADLNGDGKSDILLAGGSALAYWLMDSTVRIADAYAGNGGPNARVVAVADFDGNGASDLVWANGSALTMWLSLRNGAFDVRSVGSYGNGYQPLGAGDVDGDGRADIIFAGSSAMAYWSMNGSAVLASRYAGDAGAGFRLFQVADYNGDGITDIGWQNGSQVKLWMNNGTGGYTPTIISSYVCCWAPEGGLFP